MEQTRWNQSLGALLTTAGLAPSGDNTQPWRFVVDADAGTITLEVDPDRDPSPMNAGQRMSRVAVGAAAENLLRAAEALGLDADLGPAPPPALARARLKEAQGRTIESLSRALTERVTNRRPYDGRPLPADLLEQLIRATPELDGVTTHWIVDPARRAAWANLIGRGDALMFGEPSLRHAILANIRLDAAPGAPVVEGLPVSSLEASPMDRLALKFMKYYAPDWLLDAAGVGKAFAAKSRKLVASASGICLIVSGDSTDWADLIVGRAMQRAWLALTERNLAAQPMMSLVVLENAAENGSAALRGSLGRDRLAALRNDLLELEPGIGGRRPAFLLRFGFASSPTGRAKRLPWQSSTVETPSRND